MNQRLDRIDGCHPLIKQPVLRLVELCERKLGRKLLLVYGFRSVQEQVLIYQKGRSYDRESASWVVTDKAQIVTNALPGSSAHNVITVAGVPAAMAVDVIPLNPDGSADWGVSENWWDQLYELAWKCGLDPLGDPTGSYLAGDRGHFEEPAWKLKLDGLNCYLPVSPVGPAQV